MRKGGSLVVGNQLKNCWWRLLRNDGKSVKCYPGGRRIHLFQSISDTVTKVVPLCSVYNVPGTIFCANLTLLAQFLPDFAFLSMPFVLEMVCTADHLKNKWHAQISQLCGKC